MRFDVYCDESRPDLLSSEKPTGRYMVIGSLWLETENRALFKKQVHELREKHRIGGEFKWQKVSRGRFDFYKEVIDWYFERGSSLRFRCIAVDREKVNLVRYHVNDQELGFYKFYYQMLHHWIFDFNKYSIFCDFKTNRQRDRLHVLQRCLAASNLSSEIFTVQAIRSRESLLLQLCDTLTGAASARLNVSVQPGSDKSRLLDYLESRLGRRITRTALAEPKFNVFVIDLQGGW